MLNFFKNLFGLNKQKENIKNKKVSDNRDNSYHLKNGAHKSKNNPGNNNNNSPSNKNVQASL